MLKFDETVPCLNEIEERRVEEEAKKGRSAVSSSRSPSVAGESEKGDDSLDRDLVKRLHRNRRSSLSKLRRSVRSLLSSLEDGCSLSGSSIDEDVSNVDVGDLKKHNEKGSVKGYENKG